MPKPKEEWPEKGELVVCTVRELKTFGVFVSLEEYGGKEGFIHISEVSTGWVKHLRDYVREGQKIVCKVLAVDERRGHIDLSLKAVKEGLKRERIKAWKNEKKARKWLSLAAIPESELQELETKLVDAYGSLYDAFQQIYKTGKRALTELGIEEALADKIHKIALANVKPPSVHITGYVELKCPLPNGVEIIKNALMEAKKVAKDGFECSYVGAPRYRIRITAPDYKKAESILNEAANAAIEILKRNEGYGRFYRNLP
ncbi:MAG: translation initiation factor IF-2 subunit alpha [Methanophagales archaeon]|nr:translation initiation factor IF-2 subunit alpha [Methanophagales archaeon]RLG36182.1 MAG: translation initiation factor IF-2 subunit alpha [Methanosarcinales archaeon]MCW3137563.1 translation initiation factor IF-2 subunit alpha [Methanophagales archaeon]MCW3139062.1 translation initiation factor IF-2 subunit alpha [Methanophagales archaeon]MCW7069306.1 translation initiation factor IF-2 subunit alpha [Methanophagales archaeon]